MRTSCRILALVAAAASLTMVSLPAISWSAITGSPHDFSGRGWGTNEICIFCHTPHNANAVVNPLWNHAVTSASFNLYTSPTMDQPTQQPREPSKRCLSCHDGTIAIDSYGNRTGTNLMPGTPGTPGSSNLGTNLSDDHPVSVYWDHQTYNGGNPDCTLECHRSFDPDAMPFYDRYLECATCHEPHVKYPNPKMLRKPLAASEICQICHGK